MRRRTSATVALSLSVLLVLAGCLGGVGGDAGPSTTATATPSSTAANGGTPTQTYSTPRTPARPTEVADEEGNRIVNAKFVNRQESKSGEGYSHFDIRMLANTTMENVDPPAHGDVEGEPYAIVLVNGKYVERTDFLEMKDRGRYTIDVRTAGLEQHGIEPGKLRVKVLLMDQDSSSDDVYGTWSGTIRYAR